MGGLRIMAKAGTITVPVAVECSVSRREGLSLIERVLLRVAVLEAEVALLKAERKGCTCRSH